MKDESRRKGISYSLFDLLHVVLWTYQSTGTRNLFLAVSVDYQYLNEVERQ